MIRLVGFDKTKQRQLLPFSEYAIPVTLKDCLIQKSKFKDELEVVLKAQTKIEESQTQFDIPNPKTAGSTLISLSQLDEMDDHQRVTVRVTVVKVNDVVKVGSKTKQDVIVADATDKGTVTLWETDVHSLQQSKSYQTVSTYLLYGEKTPVLSNCCVQR